MNYALLTLLFWSVLSPGRYQTATPEPGCVDYHGSGSYTIPIVNETATFQLMSSRTVPSNVFVSSDGGDIVYALHDVGDIVPSGGVVWLDVPKDILLSFGANNSTVVVRVCDIAPTPTATPTVAPTDTATPTATATATPEVLVTATPAPTATPDVNQVYLTIVTQQKEQYTWSVFAGVSLVGLLVLLFLRVR